MNRIVTLYTTFPNAQEAEQVIDALLEKKIIACANMMNEVTSFYHWEGKREKATEVAVLMKTTEQFSHSAVESIHAMHSYDCPCVVVWPISDTTEGYLQWVNGETALQ